MNILYKQAEKLAKERGNWIDSVVVKNIPKWKLRFLLKAKTKLIRDVILEVVGIDLDIITEDLSFGLENKVTIKLNGKVIGERIFKY